MPSAQPCNDGSRKMCIAPSRPITCRACADAVAGSPATTPRKRLYTTYPARQRSASRSPRHTAANRGDWSLAWRSDCHCLIAAPCRIIARHHYRVRIPLPHGAVCISRAAGDGPSPNPSPKRRGGASRGMSRRYPAEESARREFPLPFREGAEVAGLMHWRRDEQGSSSRMGMSMPLAAGGPLSLILPPLAAACATSPACLRGDADWRAGTIRHRRVGEELRCAMAHPARLPPSDGAAPAHATAPLRPDRRRGIGVAVGTGDAAGGCGVDDDGDRRRAGRGGDSVLPLHPVFLRPLHRQTKAICFVAYGRWRGGRG